MAPEGPDLRAQLDARIAQRRAEFKSAQPQQWHLVSATRSALVVVLVVVLGSVRRLGHFWRSALVVIVVAGLATALAVVLRTYVVAPFWIPSQSMEPTLHGCPSCKPDRLLVDKLSYRLHAVRRGDVVVFDRPASLSDQDSHLVKRVIALAGETVSAHGGSVYIGARRLVEPYVNKACHGTLDFAPVVVPRGDVFVMGDNRCDSLDSRSFGPIPTSTIVGRAFVIVWPLGRLHWL